MKQHQKGKTHGPGRARAGGPGPQQDARAGVAARSGERRGLSQTPLEGQQGDGGQN